MPNPTSDQLGLNERVLFRCGKAMAKLPKSTYVATGLSYVPIVVYFGWPELFSSSLEKFALLSAVLIPIVWLVLSFQRFLRAEFTLTDLRLFYVSGHRKEEFTHSDISEVHLVNTRCFKSIVLWHPDGWTTELHNFQDPASVYDALIKFLCVKHSEQSDQQSEKLVRGRSIYSMMEGVLRFLGMILGGSFGTILLLVLFSDKWVAPFTWLALFTWEALFIWVPIAVATLLGGALVGSHCARLLFWRLMWPYIPVRDVHRFFPRLSDARWNYMRPVWRYSFKRYERYLTRLYGTRIELVRE